MEDALLVAVEHPFQALRNNMPDRFLIEASISAQSFTLSNQIKDCPVDVLKDQIQWILFADHLF